MKNTNIQLLALDMDGTICNHHSGIIRENILPIFKVSNQDRNIVIATGRPIYNIWLEVLKYNMHYKSKYALSYNGASIWNIENNKELKSFKINSRIVKETFKIAGQYNIDVWSYANHKQIVTNFNPDNFDEIAFIPKDIEIIQLKKGEIYTKSVYKFIIMLTGKQYLDTKLRQFFKSRHMNLAGGATSPAYEVNAGNINKGIALGWVAKKLKLNSNNIMSIGDGENDISMFKVSNIAIAMGNATSHVKSYADYITDTEVNYGVKKAIEKFLL